MKSRRKLKWERIRAKGKFRFVVPRAFFFGLGVFLSATLREFFWKENPNADLGSLAWLFALSFALPALCAGLGALWYWERNEAREDRLQSG